MTRKNSPFVWGDLEQQAFQKLKDLMCSTPVLGYPDEHSPTEIHCDGSKLGLGCTLVQIQNGVETGISYASRSLRRHEQNYSATDLECLAVLWSIQKFRPYLFGRPFKIITDHRALCDLINFKDPHGRAARWSMALQPYDFEVIHRAGKKHTNADVISRFPVKSEPFDPLIFKKDEDTFDIMCKLLDSKLHQICALECENFGTLQYADPKLQPIIDVLLREPEDENETREHKKIFENYKLEADVLYKAHFSPTGRLWRLVVPLSLQKDLIKEIHETEICHLGLEKTFHLIKDRYYWRSMFKTISSYVRSCNKCQLYNRRVGPTPGSLQPIPPPKSAFHRIGIDFVGPYPLTHPKRNTVVLTVIDHLTRYVEAYPCKAETSACAIDILKDKIFFKHGVPKEIIADQGSAFVSTFKISVGTWALSSSSVPPHTPRQTPFVNDLMMSSSELWQSW